MQKFTLILCLLFLFVGTNAEAQKIDVEKSVVEFKIGNMGFSSVKGTFSGMQGDVIFKSEDLSNSSMNVCVDAASVKTKNNQRDKHLRNEDFFEVDKYSTICFQSESVQKVKDGYLAKGKLTMHGVVKSVEIPFSVSGKTFIGQFEVKRLDYNVGGSGTFMVSDEVELKIICVLE